MSSPSTRPAVGTATAISSRTSCDGSTATAREWLRDVHARAASLWERRGEVIEALHHYLEAGEAGAAARLLREVGLRLISCGQCETVRRWAAALPQETRAAVPRLSLLHGVCESTLMWYLGRLHCLAGRVEKARDHLETALARARREDEARVWCERATPERSAAGNCGAPSHPHLSSPARPRPVSLGPAPVQCSSSSARASAARCAGKTPHGYENRTVPRRSMR